MHTRERWRRGLRLDKGQVLALHNARHRARGRGEYDFDRRLRAILLVGKDNLTQRDVAKIFEVTPSCITGWVMKYTRRGIEGLRIGKAPGKTPRLTDDQKKRLSKMIEAGPEGCGLDTGVWTGPIVRELIQRKFHVRYSVEQVRRILHQLGFSVQYPKHVLSEASQAEQDRWLRKVLPEIKKKLLWKAALYSSRTSASSSSRARSATRGRR